MFLLLEQLKVLLEELHSIFESFTWIFEYLDNILEHWVLLLEERLFIRTLLVIFDLLNRILENPSQIKKTPEAMSPSLPVLSL